MTPTVYEAARAARGIGIVLRMVMRSQIAREAGDEPMLTRDDEQAVLAMLEIISNVIAHTGEAGA